MNVVFPLRKSILSLALAGWLAGAGALASADEAKAPSLRPEVGKPVQAAIEALKARKGKEALQKLREAEAVTGRSAYESYIVDRLKGQSAALAGETATAIDALEAALASSVAPAAERAPLLATVAGQYYTARNYAKAADACTRYFKEGGADPALRTLQIQSLYLGGDHVRAGKEIQADIQATEHEGKVPSEQLLQMAADIATRQKDTALQMAAFEKLVAHYPKADYWLNLVYALSNMNGLSQQLTLDVYRLKLATHTLRASQEFVEAAQYALQAGFPVEAKKFLDAGYAAKQLGSGADAERHTRLKDMTAKKLAEDIKSLGQDDGKAAKAATGDALLNTGLNYVLHGQADKGLPMMSQALQLGGFKRGEDARLHYGVALILAGQKSKALETLRTVRGNDGTAELARLWMLYAQR